MEIFGLNTLRYLLLWCAVVNVCRLTLFNKNTSLYFFDVATDPQRSLAVETTLDDRGAAPKPETSFSRKKMTRFGVQLEHQQEHGRPYNLSSLYTSPLCSGCLAHQEFVLNDNKTTCGDLIRRHLRIEESRQLSLLESATAIAQRYPDHCARCDHRTCNAQEKVYMPYDEAAPRELNAWTLPISASLIKQKLILPPHALPDLDQFFANPATNYSQDDQDKVYRWEYNPSLVAINLSDASFESMPSALKDQKPVYFYSRRVSMLTYGLSGFTEIELGPCGHCRSARFWDDLEMVEFGLLNEKFDIIADGVFKFLGGQDYRIFKVNGQVYFSTWTTIFPLWVVPKIEKDDSTVQTSSQRRNLQPHIREELQPIYNPEDIPFQINLGYQWCCVNGCTGKNFNFFPAPPSPLENNTANDIDTESPIWVQTHPLEPLQVQRMAPCRSTVRAVKASRSIGKNNSAITRTYMDKTKLKPSFANMEEPYLWSQNAGYPYSDHRGSACCVQMEHPETGQTVLVGISHRKQFKRANGQTLGGRQYTSNFYATMAEPPFSLTALSGAFCLGHPTAQEAEMNHLAPLSRRRNLTFGPLPTDCPFISFVTTFIDHPKNPDTALIGYGINDAMSRVIEVAKADILSMLFDPFQVGA